MDWKQLKSTLQTDPRQLHRLLPPAGDRLIDQATAQLGDMPAILRGMLESFNGAQLYDYYGPSFSLFGLTPEERLNPLEWSPDWTMDAYTPRWRKAGPTRQHDWVFGISRGGELFVLHGDGTTGLWDKSEGYWEMQFGSMDELIDEIVRRGETSIKELAGDDLRKKSSPQ